MHYSLKNASNHAQKITPLQNDPGNIWCQFFLIWIKHRPYPPLTANRFFIWLLNFFVAQLEFWKFVNFQFLKMHPDGTLKIPPNSLKINGFLRFLAYIQNQTSYDHEINYVAMLRHCCMKNNFQLGSLDPLKIF